MELESKPDVDQTRTAWRHFWAGTWAEAEAYLKLFDA